MGAFCSRSGMRGGLCLEISLKRLGPPSNGQCQGRESFLHDGEEAAEVDEDAGGGNGSLLREDGRRPKA